MVATNLKAETMALMEKRSALENEMNAIIERLSPPGGPGLSGNLVDSEGFPRSDIDIPVIRAERLRLAVSQMSDENSKSVGKIRDYIFGKCGLNEFVLGLGPNAELRNDHKEITEKIGQNIQLLHYIKLPPKDSDNTHDSEKQKPSAINETLATSSHNGLRIESTGANDLGLLVNVPFAMVDEIADLSPAAEDGLQLGDQIVKFGNVEAGDSLLQKLASEAQTNQGRVVPVVILRRGARINLMVTPRSWQGRGLLGCHFQIL